MPNPFGMFGSEPGPSSASTPQTRSTSPNPAQTSQQLRRPASHGRLSKLMLPGRSRSNSAASQEAVTGSLAVNVYADDQVTSGRTTPEQRRRNAKATQSLLASDAKYKKFASQVDRCLQSFESVNEWADFISFLSRLLKTLQTPSPPYSEIPRKLIVAKRLAQCLNPALPAGVHTRALDVYAYVFKSIGVEGLKRDLLIWSSGLFPFFQYASTSVRPSLISLYETYYIPLGEDLRPATKAMILALLPGVEEETGDFFDRVLALLTNLSDAVSWQFFIQNIFLVLISSSASRLAALNFLARKLLDPPTDASSVEVGLLIRGTAAVLGDDNMLVRRSGLDLLLRILPLDGPIFKDAIHEDREHLVRAVAFVVLQRDVSLNRRVYTWFLSGNDTSESQIAYFKTNGLDLLSGTLKGDMEKLSAAADMAEAQAPFKVFLSLLDKWEIGETLSLNLAIPSLHAIQAASKGVDGSEVAGIGSAVYESIEPSVLWKKIYEGVDKELVNGDTNLLNLTLWLVTAIPQHDEETATVHAPLLLARIARCLSEQPKKEVLQASLQVANALLEMIPDSVFSPPSSDSAVPNGDTQSAEELAYTEVKLAAAAMKVRIDVAPQLVTAIFKISQEALKAPWSSNLLLLVVSLTQTLIDREVPSLSTVDSVTWVAALLTALERIPSFAVVDALVDAALRASRSQLFEPPIDITSDSVMTTVLDSLFRYLRPDAAPYHARAVELLWEYNQLAEIHTLESVIARRMSSVRHRSEAFEAFGVLWRQSDDSMLPGEIFHVPMFMVLDGLKSDDPQVLRASETWMRCNLKSYFRMFDPLLRRVMDVMHLHQGNKKGGDSSLVYYFVSSVTSLFRFGGQGLSKACKSTEFRKSVNAMFVSRAEESFPHAVTYLDLLTDLLTRLLNDTPNENQTLRVQSAALELLLLLVSRGDLTPKSLEHIKSTLVDKLTFCTQHRRLTLQNTMLHLLHSTISASEKRPRNHRVTSSTFSIPEKSPPLPDNEVEFDNSLIRMIICGVASPGNRPILQHWIDFVLMTIPHLEKNPQQLRQLCDCFCEQLRMTMLQLRNTFSTATSDDMAATITESEPIMLIGVLERLAVVLGSKAGTRRSEDRERQAGDGGGFLGYLPTVFSVEAPQDSASKCEAARYLDDIMDCLLVTWSVTEIGAEPTTYNPVTASKTQIMTRTRTRARKALEKMFKAQPSEIIGSCVQVWATDSSDISDAAIFDCLDVLAPSAQKVVDLVCEHLSGKGRGSISDSSNPALAAFLEAYISRLEGPIAVQVWNALYSYARDILGQSSNPAARSQLFSVLRGLTILGKIVSTTSALEDRRLRRDLQDTYVKVLDAVLVNSSRLGDSVLWDRDTPVEIPNTEDERASLTARGVQKIYSFIGGTVLQSLRTFLVENDRVASACSGISSNIIQPAFKQQKVDTTILNLLREMAKIPVAIKSWRVVVGDAFGDNRFFKITPEESAQWKPLVCALMDSDKERLGDLLGRIAAGPSANIFTNREQETISRSLNLRRLSFVLLAAERNHHLAQLPSIQEKLVEILRTNVVAPRVHSEVYLCLRVLMCRISPQHLANFWPVILAELLRVFESTMDDPPVDGSEDLALVLAACKFLDLLLVIQSEDFQIHQWIFVTDTTDAEFPPEDYSPEALMDRLTDILAQAGTVKPVANAVEIQTNDSSAPRKPHLANVKALSSLQQLQPFFARASIETFEGVYADVGVDWDTIEEGLTGEIFEGEKEQGDKEKVDA